jgi:hypothetical protein
VTGTNELAAYRVEEIRNLALTLTATARAQRTEPDTVRLLHECTTALRELLDDRDALVRANDAAGEEIARWSGALR